MAKITLESQDQPQKVYTVNFTHDELNLVAMLCGNVLGKGEVRVLADVVYDSLVGVIDFENSDMFTKPAQANEDYKFNG